MERATRTVQRALGLGLLGAALWPMWRALQFVDRREFVAALVATGVGWLVLRAGTELVRPDSAE